jgi:hypothetical protein
MWTDTVGDRSGLYVGVEALSNRYMSDRGRDGRRGIRE